MSANARALQRSVQYAMLVAIAAITVSAPVFSAEGRAIASATVVDPLTIATDTHLSFGRFEALGKGSITVDTAGARAAKGVRLGGGSPSAASFSISSQSGLSYNIAYTGTSATLSNGEDMLGFTLVSDLGGVAASSGAPMAHATLGSGPATLRVGGTLTVDSAGALPGIYKGTISVVVEYQ